MQSIIFFKKKSVLLIFTILLLLQFNNCSPIKSQLNTNSGVIENSSNTIRPYLLKCLDSSDGVKVSSSLAQALLNNSGVYASKINSLDWQQDTDLIVTLDNHCLKENQLADSMLKYIDAQEINTQLSKTVYVIKKESVLHLQDFINDALASECLLSANKNEELKVSVDPYISRQTHLIATSSNPVAINLLPNTLDQILAYVNSGSSSVNKKVKIAVIDTGVDTGNPDLAAIISRNTDGTFKGYNTTTQPSLGFLKDSGYHGTHVSGLMAAQYNNNYGVTGVYGRNIELFPFRASNNGDTFTIAALVNAIQIAVEVEKVDIINMSFSTSQDYTELRQAINQALAAGVTIVVAAGNGDANGVGQILGTNINSYPAMYSGSNNGLITVGSLDLKSQSISRFSNRSSQYVDLLSPGSNGDIYTNTQDNREGIFSTIPVSYNGGTGVGSIVEIAAGEFETVNGTSMSAPLVTGALASVISMAKSHNVKITNSTLKTWLRGSGSSNNLSYKSYSANGSFLNLLTLFSYAKLQIDAMVSTPPPTPAVQNLKLTSQPISQQLVVGETLNLNIIATSTNTITYQWYLNNNAINGAISSQLSTAQANESNGGAYFVRVKSGSETIDSQTVEVKIGLSYCAQ